MPAFTEYRNWRVSHLSNRWIDLFAVPQLGGRIIQLAMDGYEYFFVNNMLAGKEPDATPLGEKGSWMNFGGEKIWPAPQGWNSPDRWPGPPDPVLDSGVYSLTADDDRECITMTSPKDDYTGLQIRKEVSVNTDSPEVTVTATFVNTAEKAVCWSVWPVLQLNTPGEKDGQYRVVCPVNSNSRFSEGFKVMHGLVNNPQYTIDDNGNFCTEYRYLVGKAGLDTDAGWAAFVDSETGKVLVVMSGYEKDKDYPEETSFQVWTSGHGMVWSRNVIREHIRDRVNNPPYLEMELLSPLTELQPGEKKQFEYRILTCTIPVHETVQKACRLGVIASALKHDCRQGGLLLTARYGFFYEGFLKIHRSGERAGDPAVCMYEERVSPLAGVTVEMLCEEEIPEGTSFTATMYTVDNTYIGELEKYSIIL